MWVCQYGGVVLFRCHGERLYLHENVPVCLFQAQGRGHLHVFPGQNPLSIVEVSLFGRVL
jgi:hypothetical protein